MRHTYQDSPQIKGFMLYATESLYVEFQIMWSRLSKVNEHALFRAESLNVVQSSQSGQTAPYRPIADRLKSANTGSFTTPELAAILD